MIAVDVLRALAVLALASTAQCMPLALWQMALASVMVSAFGALFDPSLQASIPELAQTPSTLQAMNALMMVNHRLARTVGPGCAGLLVALMPIHHFFTLDAISFLVSAAAIFSLGRNYRWKALPSKAHAEGFAGICKDIALGAKMVWQHEQLRWSFAIYVISCVAWAAGYIIGIPLFAKQALRGDVGTFGAIVAAYGFGSVLSNIAMGAFVTRRRMFFVSISEIVFGIGFLILAFARSLPVACLGAGFAASGGPMSDIMLVAMMQCDMPREHLGKVNSLRFFIMNSGLGIGLLLAPALFTAVSPRMGIAISAVIFAIIGSIGLIRFGLQESLPVKESQMSDITDEETSLISSQ
jgi:MFS family permease